MVNAIWMENLNKVLEYESRLYKQLLTIAENKTGIVVKGELESLQTLVEQERKLVGELSKLQDVREKILVQIAKDAGKNPDELTLAEITALLPKEQGQKLSKFREQLKDTISQLANKNDLNQKLIQNALDYVDFSLNLLTQPAPQMTQYGRKGNETGVKSRGVLDIKY